MEITYKNNMVKKVCTQYSEAVKTHGDRVAIKLHTRLREIQSADTVEEMILYRIGRCHRLEGPLKGQYAMDLGQPYRLVFKKTDKDGRCVRILSIEDYH